MTDSSTQPGSRIAIKFGKPTANGAIDKPSRTAPPSSLGKRPRAHQGFEAADESDDDGRTVGKLEAISSLGETKTEKPRVIQRQANDLQILSKIRRTNQPSAPGEAAKQRAAGNSDQSDDVEKPQVYGLITSKKKKNVGANATVMGDPSIGDQSNCPSGSKQLPADPENEAVDALLGNANGVRRRVIAREDFRDEDASFKKSLQKYAQEDEPDFEDMPVEEFGAALLRGMGWDGKMTKDKATEVKRRENLLGLGAKHLEGTEDLGQWNQKRPKLRDHRREEEEKRRAGRDNRRHESYKEERDRERRQHDHDRGSGGYKQREYNRR